jgi:hypothetical protein
MPTENLNLSQADDLERRVLEERERRAKAKVERGEAVLEQIFVVVGGAEDADDAVVSAKAERLAELRAAGQTKEIIFADPNVIITGVPRPERDPKYVERQERERATLNAEERRWAEKEAEARLDAFHEAAKSHEPEPTPAPMPKSVIAEPPSDLQWTGVIAPISARAQRIRRAGLLRADSVSRISSSSLRTRRAGC